MEAIQLTIQLGPGGILALIIVAIVALIAWSITR